MTFTRTLTGALLVSDRNEGYDFAGLNQPARALLPAAMPVTTVNRADGSDDHVVTPPELDS